MAEVNRSVGLERISRPAIDDGGTVVGWIGGYSRYEGNVQEPHALVVRPDHRGEGIGRVLVSDLEEQVRQRGGITLWVGTDDQNDMTKLSGVDLYPDVLGHLARIENLRGHPYEFYQKAGFVIVGVMPDANGFGKPDIHMPSACGRANRSIGEGPHTARCLIREAVGGRGVGGMLHQGILDSVVTGVYVMGRDRRVG